MSTESSSSAQPTATLLTPEELGAEIRRTAERAAREGRAEAERQSAAADPRMAAKEERTKSIRQKRLLAALLGTFLLLSALNLAGFGFHRSPRPAAWTEETLQRYLREELQFEVESIEFFVREQGRIPRSLEEMGYPRTESLKYEVLGEDSYRITISDSGKSLTYDSHMDQLEVFGEQIDD